MTVIPLDSVPTRAAPRKITPLSPLALPLLPIMLRLSAPGKRDLLERRAALTVKLREKRRAQKELQKILLREARDFEQIIVSTWSRLGEYHRPRSQNDGPERRARVGKVQKVKFEYIGCEAERIYFKILARKQTLFGYKSALPHMVRASDLTDDFALHELSVACERTVTQYSDDYRRGVWVIVNRTEGISGLPAMVNFRQMLDHYPSDVGKATIILGVGEHRKVHSVNLADYPHVLIAGSTGSGKSNIVNNIIASLMRFTDATDLNFRLIDLKRMEFGFYDGAPHLGGESIIFTAEGAIECLEGLVKEMQRRAELMSSRVKELDAWNKKFPEQKMPRLVVVIDEFAELTLASGKKTAAKVLELVNRISNLGRSVGIHLIVCTQRPAVTVLPNSIKINMPLIIAGRTQSGAQSRVIIDNDDAAKLPDKPRGRMIYLSGMTRASVQTPFIEDEDVIESVRIACGRAAGLVILDGNEVMIRGEALREWIAAAGGRVDGKMAHKLRDYGIAARPLANFAADLVRRGLAIKDGKACQLLEPTNDPVAAAPDIEGAKQTLKAIRASKGNKS